MRQELGQVVESDAPGAIPSVQRPLSNWPSIVFLLVPLLLTLAVLWLGYSSAVDKRYDAVNALSPEIVSGGSFGQSFVARYSALSSVEVHFGTYGRDADPTRATLILHLRSGPTSKADIASVTLPPTAVIRDGGWYTFSFQSIPDSQGKSFYAEVDAPDGTLANSVSIYWFKPNPIGDPYADGVAYRNGQPMKADLQFGLGYSASPLEVWGDMLGSAAANSSPMSLGAPLIAAVAVIVWSLAFLPRILRDPEKRDHWLLRWSLPFVLIVALTAGLLFMLLLPPWQGPDEYSHFGYVALLDRHNLDGGQVKSLDLYGKDRDQALIDAVNASMNRHDFTRLVAGSTGPGAPADVWPNIFQQSRQPLPYYWLCAVALRVARAFGAPANPYANPESALIVMRSVSLLLSLVLVALAWLAGALLSRGSNPWLRLLLPLTVALLPMYTFVGTSVNNDILAEVATSALFVSLVALLRWPSGVRGLALAALSVLLALSTVETKTTATAAALPLLACGLLVWLGLLVWGRTTDDRPPTTGDTRFVEFHVLRFTFHVSRPRSSVDERNASYRPSAASRAIPLACIVAALLVLLAGVLFLYKSDDNGAADWFLSFDPIQRAERVQSTTAHQGSYVIQLNPGTAAQAVQNLVPPVYHPAFNVTFSGWVRLAPGETFGAQGVNASLSLYEDTRKAGSTGVQLDPVSEWKKLTVTGRINASAGRVQLSLEVAGEPADIQFDDMSLKITPVGAPWNDPVYKPALLDPSGEQPALVLNDLVSSHVPNDIRATAEAIVNPQPFDKLALWRDYALAQYWSYWGNFGWLTIMLPSFSYTLLGILLLIALVGLLLRVVYRPSMSGTRTSVVPCRWSRWSSLGVAVLLSLAAAIIIGLAKQTGLLAYTGLPAYPQGRYLFVLAIPTVWLILTGLAQVGKLVFSRLNSRRTPTPNESGKWLAWAWANALGFFCAYCLLALMVPFYYA